MRSGAGFLTMGLEDLADGLAVPHLLVGPAGEEGRNGRVAVGGGEEEVPQIADGVVLDIVCSTACGAPQASAADP